MKKRHVNSGIRKICDHPRRQWASCEHPWHFAFKWKDRHFRFSLDKHFNRHIDSKTTAEELAGDLRKAIRAGTFGKPTPVHDTLTVAQLLAKYTKDYIEVSRPDALTNVGYQIATITRTEIARADGQRRPFGEWLVSDVTTDAVDAFKAARSIKAGNTGGVIAANRDTALLRAAFTWATSRKRKYVTENPFRDGDKAAVKLSEEHPRSRRLEDGEETRLLAACGPHLRALVEAAIETGCRRGELLSLQWKQVEGMRLEGQEVTWASRAEVFLPHQKTKTKKDRRVPLSSRLKVILAMRRCDPAGDPLTPDAFVFGSEIGTRVDGFKRAWSTAVLKAHGYTPVYTTTGNLTPECRAALAKIDLHFHDLRREAGSRWLDGGVPLHVIRDWLGHSDISQTSTYLSSTIKTQHDAMAAYETRLQRLATDVGTGGKTKAWTATRRDRKPNKTTVRREPAIM
jgi:integrase